MSDECSLWGNNKSKPPRTPGFPLRQGCFIAAAHAGPKQLLNKSKGAPARCLLWQLWISVNKDGVQSVNDGSFFLGLALGGWKGRRSAVPHSKLLRTQLARRGGAQHRPFGRSSALLLTQNEGKNHPPASCCAGRGVRVQPGGRH